MEDIRNKPKGNYNHLKSFMPVFGNGKRLVAAHWTKIDSVNVLGHRFLEDNANSKLMPQQIDDWT